MCGICGVLRFDGAPVDTAGLERMNHTLVHRGPDDSGIFVDSPVGLAHRRLTIIDLSERGRQPMANEDGSIVLACNGEIYNYKELRAELAGRGHTFRSCSDNEVIIHGYEEWGEEAWKKLEGMFAFALWDGRSGKLYLVRDYAGIKPLFYYRDRKKLVFSSEIKAILAHDEISPPLDLESLNAYLSYFYVPQPRTIFKGINHVRGGHFLRVGGGSVEESPYWELEFDPDRVVTDEKEALSMLRHKIAACVERSLVSDVPVGLLLSAGMDSTVLLHEMSKVYPGRIKTFTGFFDDPTFDESGLARETARRYGTEHHDIRFSFMDVRKELESILWHYDSLSANPTCLPVYLLYKLAASEVKVAVFGSGGDELFAGYETYIADRIAPWLRRLPVAAKRMLLTAGGLLPVSHRYLGFDYKYRKFAEGLFFQPGKSHYWWRTIFTDDEKARLFSPEVMREIGDPDCYRYYRRYIEADIPFPSDLDRFLYADFKLFLGDNALPLVDMLSMAHSLESRPSLLQRDLIEFAFHLPFSMKLRGRRLKYCLRQAYADDLPREILTMPKRGQNAPIGKMINGPLKGWVSEVLCSPGMQRSGLFNESFVHTLLKEQFSLTRDHSYKIWALLCFALWYDLFGRPAP